MSTATLPPLDLARALTDVRYYDQRIDKADDHKQVEAAVTAYADAHAPAARLDYVETRILDFAARILQREWTLKGELEQAIRDEFDLSATRYYQILGWLIDQRQALAYAPVTVNRLRAVREMKRQARSARQLDARSAA